MATKKKVAKKKAEPVEETLVIRTMAQELEQMVKAAPDGVLMTPLRKSLWAKRKLLEEK